MPGSPLPSAAPADPLEGVRVWVDGELLGLEATVRALDHGLTVGDGVFETAKVVDGRPFALSRHHDRMDRSLAGLGLEPLDRARLQEGIDAVLGLGTLRHARLRYTVTAGLGPLGSDRIPGAATYVVTAMEVPPAGPSTTVAVVPWTRNERGALAGVKSTSYAENVLALCAAKRLGHSEAILANTAGMLCEGTGTNVFVVTDGVVRTPALSSGPLAGVTRALTIEWLREEGVEVVEQELPLSVLADCEELWVTSSTRDVCAVTRYDVVPPAVLLTGEQVAVPGLTARTLGEGPGPLARVAQEVFARRSADDLDP